MHARPFKEAAASEDSEPDSTSPCGFRLAVPSPAITGAASASFVLGCDLCLDTLVTHSNSLIDRRRFLAVTGAAAAGPASGVHASPLGGLAASQAVQPASAGKARFRTGLVAYSYRVALEAKTMTYE